MTRYISNSAIEKRTLYSKRFLWTLWIAFFSVGLQGQEKFLLHGTVHVAVTEERLAGVNIWFPELQTGTTTNEYGFFSLRLPSGTQVLEVSYLGYLPQRMDLVIEENRKVKFALTPAAEDLKEVIISENADRTRIFDAQMGTARLKVSRIKEIPVIFGEVDIIKALTLLPGVSNAGEGSSGFNVRGGAADQNLILLDEATIYNGSHLFGLFSIFNPDAIRDLTLYKGGIPAKYGGRVSSVLDIYQKKGNTREFGIEGGLGLISSRLLVEGPLKEGNSSFLIGGRASYAHLFLKLSDNENSAYFYDLNTKVSTQVNDKNTILFSGYFGRDVFQISQSFINRYGNSIFNLRWNSILRENLFSNLSLIYSDYYYGLTLNYVGFDWSSGIKNANIKYDLEHHISNKTTLNYGIHNTWYGFNPGRISPSDKNSGINPDQLTKKYAFENALYLDVEQDISQKVEARYGLRLSNFLRMGQSYFLYPRNEALLYNENLGIYEEATPSGIQQLDRASVDRDFWNLEPRLSLSYRLDDDQVLKIGYNRMTQYIHLITNTSSPTPLDVWAPSGRYLAPQKLDQFSAGYYRLFGDESYALEMETFYKDLRNRIDYIDGANLIANNAIERVILPGMGRAYGLEVLFKKSTGSFTGWLAYTWSRSEQRTPGRTKKEPGINNGQWYPTPYDKEHDLSLSLLYRINNRWNISSNFIFQTGLPATFPTGFYEYENLNVPVFATRNSNRLPAYHRLDLAATFRPSDDPAKRFQSSWSFGIYNVYNRHNAASISFRRNEDTDKNEAVRLSLFGIVPAVTYNFKF